MKGMKDFLNKGAKVTPWGEIGYIVYKRTYARRLKEGEEETEEFADTIERVLRGCDKQLGVGFTKKEEDELRDIFLELKGSVAGRFLWQLGTKTVDKLGLFSLQNCSFTVVNHPIEPFVWAMDALMLGSGVGFNIQREHVYQLPKLPKKKVVIKRVAGADADFIVPDTRQGWVKLLGKVLKAYFLSGKGFSYSTMCVRGAGTPIIGFGGTASGPEILVAGIENICKVLQGRRGKRARPIDCLDVMNIIGEIVVAGGIRRSAQIAIGDMDDFEFLNAKRWDLGNIPNWRANSNNTVVCDDFSKLPEQFWEGYRGNGEPYGLINIANARKTGRAGETQYLDSEVEGVNPCGEQFLADRETCCLAEIFLPNIGSKEELLRVSKYLYRINKHSLALKCHQPSTEKIVHANMRMGIGITGYCMSSEEQKGWLSETYEALRVFDVEYSAANNFPVSIKLTTVKPSGTLSLLAGVTPGGHPGFSEFHIRRVRISSDSKLIDVCRKNGYKIEYVKNFDGTENRTTYVVEFPCKLPSHATFSKDISAIQQLEIVKRLQEEWSDNAVSVTVYYAREELSEIREWLAVNYNKNIKSLSFLLHSEHGFVQAPLEEITKEEYEKMSASTAPITDLQISENDISGDQIGCAGGLCPIK